MSYSEMSEHYDVIVCGAGPAGATAARLLAESGRKVAIIERRRLPRHKTCGGGVPVSVSRHLRQLSAEAFVESNVKHIRHTLRFGKPLLCPINSNCQSDQSLWMVQRSIFDNALCQSASNKGAGILDGLTVRAMERSAGRVTLKACQEASNKSVLMVSADRVIGADGANGICARLAGLRSGRKLAIAVEIEKEHRWGDGHSSLRPDIAHLDFGNIDHGYAWVFPKREHLNIGAGIIYPHRKHSGTENKVRDFLQNAVQGYMRLLEIPFKPEELKFYAHPLPAWDSREPLSDPQGRVLLVGDAAGLVNPFFGDGIMNAIRSGEIAAQAILSGQALSYTNLIHKEFAANLDSAHRYARFFYRHTDLCYRYGVTRQEATRVAMRLLSDDLKFPEIKGRLLKRFGRFVLGRFQPDRTQTS